MNALRPGSVIDENLLVAATNAVMALGIPDIVLQNFVQRHLDGDWGLVDEQDRATNNAAVEFKCRVMSVWEYEGTRLWIITDTGWEVTTVLLPGDY